MRVSIDLGLGCSSGFAAIAGPPSPNRQVLLIGVKGTGVAGTITVSTVTGGAPSLDFSQAANSQYLTMGFI